MIYLDNNATTALDPQVAEAMLSVWASGPLNASSQHASGRAARNRLDDALSEIAGLLGADIDSPGGDTLVMTSGGTESNNLAIRGIGDPQAPLVISSIEHPSVIEPARTMAAASREVRVIPVGPEGVICLETAARLIKDALPRPGLVSVMTANNETGVIQPIERLAEICNSAGIPLHVDATQTVGRLAMRFDRSGVAAVTATAHKFHGPAGIGILLLRSGIDLRPQFQGGEQQMGKRPGTEPVALGVGMAEALRLATEKADETARWTLALRDLLESGLSREFDDLVIHGGGTPRLPATSCLSFPAVDRQTMLLALDSGGVACSSGSACASGSSKPSHVLVAMAAHRSLIDTALRFGFSRFSTDNDASTAIETISRCYRRLGKKKPVEKSP
jgi:cysteine desulfurase